QPANFVSILKGGKRSNAFNVGSTTNTLSPVQGYVYVYGSELSSSNTVNLSDQGSATPSTYVLVHNYFTVNGGPIVAHSHVRFLNVKGGTAANEFYVASTPPQSTTSLTGNAADDLFVVFAAKVVLTPNNPSANGGLGGPVSIDAGGGTKNELFVNTA